MTSLVDATLKKQKKGNNSKFSTVFIFKYSINKKSTKLTYY